jgi:hypothetical protein
MTNQPLTALRWSTLHPSALPHAAAPPQCVVATPRRHGALRYSCPATGSFVLVTDETTLASLSCPRARLRCADCGEMHLLVLDGETGATR